MEIFWSTDSGDNPKHSEKDHLRIVVNIVRPIKEHGSKKRI